MRRTIFVVIVLLAFNSGALAVTIDWVTVGNPGNIADTTGDPNPCGAVDYEYQISTYEITAGQYTEFLTAVATTDTTDTYGLYNTAMADISFSSNVKGCGIFRGMTIGPIDILTGEGGDEVRYIYYVATDWADRPVNYVSWYNCLRFANWLHNGQPTGLQDTTTTEDGAYDMSLGDSVVRKAGARVWLPNEDEWYKAAYHKNDGVTGNYFDYPTSSDSVPSNDLVEPTDPGNNATFSDYGDYTIYSPYYRTEVGAHENSDSPYGTFDMGGNVFEWNETLFTDSYSRGMRGGSHSFGEGPFLKSDGRVYLSPDYDDSWIGFRVASVLEPTATEVSVDIKPGSCPNRMSLKSKGVLRAAVLGAEGFDVNTIDLASIRLAGVAPIRSGYEDVSTPAADSNDCACPEEDGGDGIIDLVLKFDTQEIVGAIGDVGDSEEWILELSGSLNDGTEIEGSDCVVIVGNGNSNSKRK